MRDVELIEKAVANLPPRELAEFTAWFENYAAERFDEVIARDAEEGKLDREAETALREFREGKAREL